MNPKLLIAVTLVAATAILGRSTVPALAGMHSLKARELLYVANADNGPVTAYDSTSSGPISPRRVLDNPTNPNTFWDPWGIAFDSSGNAYVQTFLSNATTIVFPPGAATPTRIFQVTAPDSESIAVDRHGYEYVMGGKGPPVVSVAAPTANGQASNLAGVGPLRQIQTGQPGFAPWANVLSVDNHNQVLTVVLRSTGNAIEVYRGGAAAPNTPIRVIAGRHTGLGSCTGFDACDHVSITYSAYTGRIYSAVSAASGTHISVFAGGANGDVHPIRTISGSNTGLAGKVITGIADSQRTGEIYVLAKSTQFSGPAAVEVFARLAAGNAAPLRSFTDAHSRLADGQGIGIAP